jgi:hypothetical protein
MNRAVLRQKLTPEKTPSLYPRNKMSIAKFTITLHRPNSGAANDDVINISPFMDDFKIEYVSKHDKVRHFVYAPADHVVRYVEDLFYLLPNDYDAFEYIQFDIPCFPQVMFSVATMDDKVVKHTIRDRVLSVLNNWPERIPYSPNQRPSTAW